MQEIRKISLGKNKLKQRSVRVSSWQMMLQRGKTRSRVRVWPFTLLSTTLLVLLTGRLFQLTIVEGAYYRQWSDNNRVLNVRLTAERGVFIDRMDRPLVVNEPLFKRQVPGTSLPQGLFEPISREKALAYVAEGSERIYFDVHRRYVCGVACSTVLGYVAEIDQAELAQQQNDYIMGDSVGKAGLEKTLEKILRGVPGNEVVEIDAQGNMVRQIGREAWQPGSDVRLTMDVELQSYIYAILEREQKSGAVVVQNPTTGEVLALVSFPSYDPNNLSVSLNMEGQPFFNRAVAGAYPPGSVFKIVPAVAALEDGKITSTTTFEDTGELVVDAYRFGTWYYDEHGRVEGAVDVVKGLQRSNDIFFYRIGELVGVNSLANWARLFGYGESMTLSGLQAASGTIPDPEWKEQTKGERWYLGNTYHMSIGQGDVLVTPLQVNGMMGAIANNGSLCPPKLLQDEIGKQSCRQLNLQDSTIELISEGLHRACLPGGTGVPFFNGKYQVGCKTGTAQQGGEKEEPHAWFTVFAPFEDPEITLTVLIEKGGQGSQVAAPIAKEIVDWWMEHRFMSEKR